MEILQTIWNALTTENEKIAILICTPLIFIEIYISMLLFSTILNIIIEKKQKIQYVIILGIIGLITAWTIPVPFNTFINIIACPILVYFMFKTNILKSILAEIIPYIIFAMIASLILNICVTTSNIPADNFVKIPVAKLLSSLILYFITYLLYLLIHHFNINLTIIENLKRKNNLILIINIIIGVIAITMQSYLISIYSNTIPFSTMLLCIFVLLVYFSFSMYSLLRTNKLEITTQSLEEEKLYNKTLTILYDNIRGFRHNFNNIVQAIGRIYFYK